MSQTEPFLQGYVDLQRFPTEVDRDTRSIRRWMDEVDGLPYVQLGSRRLIHLESARAWLMSRIKHRNPERRRRKR